MLFSFTFCHISSLHKVIVFNTVSETKTTTGPSKQVLFPSFVVLELQMIKAYHNWKCANKESAASVSEKGLYNSRFHLHRHRASHSFGCRICPDQCCSWLAYWHNPQQQQLISKAKSLFRARWIFWDRSRRTEQRESCSELKAFQDFFVVFSRGFRDQAYMKSEKER